MRCQMVGSSSVYGLIELVKVVKGHQLLINSSGPWNGQFIIDCNLSFLKNDLVLTNYVVNQLMGCGLTIDEG